MTNSGVRLTRRRFLSHAAGAVVASALPLRAAIADDRAAWDGAIDVAIIGGGLAGLTAARDLRRAGCE